MRFWFAAVVSAFAVPACVLPSAEVDENFLTGGAGGSAPRGGAAGSGGAGGLAGRGGSAGKAAIAGSAGAGGDPREDACIEYCDLYFQACELHPSNTYVDDRACRSTCFLAPWPFGSDPEEKDSVQCRLVHAGFAVDISPDPHCFHSAAVPTMGACEP
jgi:hypothetical protein